MDIEIVILSDQQLRILKLAILQGINYFGYIIVLDVIPWPQDFC